ncbi:SigE family RNA polymerase sigma factor [Nocardioides sp.]|uniref:SigE family RNA polymerase sigma factor n=1 Tax=Nocardioides sp. TaxID=35761 RepID=UPI0027160211|nr:SigE family RNA polymerase sigma factor [Nocardioides sp.]MDO9454689.1 SigE family RNA polymerase sigma factor [Nocardioides sp.]
MSTRTQDYEEFARARTPALLRSAWLLCGDTHLAEDLVQDTLAKVYVRWHAPFRSPIETPVAYAQTTLTRTFLSSRRRRSSTEQPYADLPDRPLADGSDATATRLALQDALAGLAPADRAVLVLRYLDDLSVEETADRMGVSPGAVRSRSPRAVARLRPLLDASLIVTSERGTTHG